MVAGLLAAAIFLVDAGIKEAVGGERAQQQMVDAEARVAPPRAGRIVPESVDRPFRVAGTDGVGPTLVEDGAQGRLSKRAGRALSA